ncbi:MAG: DUF6048 family protein [Flavobacteriaceae bacterium]
MVCFGYAQDSIPKYTERYSIRFGIDMSKPIRSMIENDYIGLELTADYRITKKLYLAAEVGTEDKRVVSETLDFQTSGEYIKLGVDFNLFNNWEGMENMLLTGFRFGTSTHSQQLNGYAVRQLDHLWAEDLYKTLDQPLLYDDLSATWIEIIAGVKTELLNNLYMGISVRMNYLMNDKEATNFSNLYIPGYHRVSEGSPWGVGLNYTMMYQFPLYRK